MNENYMCEARVFFSRGNFVIFSPEKEESKSQT